MSRYYDDGPPAAFRWTLTIVCALAILWIVWQGIFLFMGSWIEAGHVGVMYSATSGLEKDASGNVKILTPKRV